jgi:hypothetical protein
MRIRAPLLLCLLVLLLQACTLAWDESQLEANIVRPGNFKAGSGVIQSVGAVRDAERTLYRLSVYMDGGVGHQTVDIDSSRFLAGEAVELTNDARVVRVTGTTLNKALTRDR